MRNVFARAALLFGLLPCGALSQARAEGPAVSQLNGKASVEGGATGSSGRSSVIGTAQGSITAPLDQSFGVQFDGMLSTAYNSVAGGGAAHLFWRDPQVGLFGPVAALAGARGGTIGWYGAEGEFYANNKVTLAAMGGYQDGGGTALWRAMSGGFYQGRVGFYPIPDLMLGIAGGQWAGRTIGSGRIEYQPDFIASHNVALFVDADVGDDAYYKVTSGVRIYFGPDKTLVRRHREDDPISSPSSMSAYPDPTNCELHATCP